MSREPLSDRDLARLLDAQIDAMQSVLTSLEAERQALSARDGDALLRAVSSKAASIASADTIEGERQVVLDRLGSSERRGRGGRDFSADAGISQRWQHVLTLTQQCRALNEANGQMIRGQRRRVEGTLRILRGEPVAPVEYGPAGEHRSRGSTRSLGSY
jgi:flagellar biosynthesis protein FlgN